MNFQNKFTICIYKYYFVTYFFKICWSEIKRKGDLIDFCVFSRVRMYTKSLQTFSLHSKSFLF